MTPTVSPEATMLEATIREASRDPRAGAPRSLQRVEQARDRKAMAVLTRAVSAPRVVLDRMPTAATMAVER